MGVRRFRNVEEMEDELWRSPDDPDLHAAIRRVWEFADRTCPRRFPPGVYRHRSIEDAQRLRDEWERANFEAYWDRQRNGARA